MTLTKIPLKGWTDDQKRAFRSQGLGGSDISAVPGIGLSKYKSGVELYLEKIGEPVFEFKGNRFTEFGKLHEAEIAEELYPYYELGGTVEKLFENKKNGVVVNHVAKYPYKLVNNKYPWLFSEVDRKITTIPRKPGVLECKNTTTMARKEFKEGIDPSFICQLQHYMLVTNWDYGHLALEVDGNNFDCIEFGAIPEVQEAIQFFSATFWQKVEQARAIKKEFELTSYYGMNPELFDSKQRDGVYMLQALEPDLTGVKCEVEFLRKFINPTPEYTETVGTSELLELAKQYKEADAVCKNAATEADRLYNEIIKLLGGIHVAKFEDGDISYKEDKAGRKRLYISPKLIS